MLFRSLSDVIVLCVLVNLPVKFTFAFQVSPWNVLKRSTGQEQEVVANESPMLACEEQQLRSSPGEYTFFGTGEKTFCSLYIVAPMDFVVQMEFTYFDVDCDDDGAVALLDGWELDFEIFPNNEDHPHPMSLRYLPFCGKTRPSTVYTTKQNIAQIQFVVPIVGQGFRVRVDFKVNHKPCNMMLMTNNYDKITLRNYGLRRNCTVMSLYPQRLQFLYVNIGEKEKDSMFFETRSGPSVGLRTMCQNEFGQDSVQLYQGTGVGSVGMRMVLGFCGIRQTSAPRSIRLRCHSSAVRLESSGQYFNMVKFALLPAEVNDGTVC